MSRREKLAKELLENGQANKAGDDDEEEEEKEEESKEPTLEEQVGEIVIRSEIEHPWCNIS